MINVKSEYKKLKKVLLHRPGYETENITPSMYERLLFEDSYYLKEAQREHDFFADVLRKNDVEVVYLEDLVAETLKFVSKEIKLDFIREFISEDNIIEGTPLFERIFSFLTSIYDEKELVIKMMEGTRVSELPVISKKTLLELEENERIWALEPLPNLVFTRDPFASIGNGVSIHKMKKSTRRRETIFAQYIFKFHPDYKDTPRYYKRSYIKSLEGGDVMILSSTDLAIGISERTDPDAIEKLAKNLFEDPNSEIKTIWGISIPKGRSWMHLDTVFTQIDINKFAIFSNYEFNIFKITNDNGETKVSKEKFSIDKLMSQIFKQDHIDLIHCGGGDPVHSEREQWNDGSNVLAIAPNEVIVYDRNYVTNKILREHGVIVHEIPSYELSRGRGGPRCMSMPLYRED